MLEMAWMRFALAWSSAGLPQAEKRFGCLTIALPWGCWILSCCIGVLHMVAGALRKYGFEAWFCLLTCMPYLLSSKLFGAAISTSYTFVALGVLSGFAAVAMVAGWRIWMGDELSFSHGAMGRVFLVAGIALTIAVLTAESFTLFNYVDVGVRAFVEGAPLRQVLVNVLGLHADVEPVILFVVGFCWSVAFSAIGPERKDFESGLEETCDLQFSFIGLACIYFLVGFFSRALCVCVYVPFSQDGLISDGLGYYAPVFAFAGFFPLLFVFGCALLLFAAPVPGGVQEERRFSSGVPAVSFSLGMLCWSCLQRVVDPYEVASGYAVATAAAVFLVFLIMRRVCFARRGRKKHSEKLLKPSVSAGFKSFLEVSRLSPRETEAVLLCIEGRTSAESAGIMGIKDVTVRSLLQRAYKKIGVASKDELLALAGISVKNAHPSSSGAPLRRNGFDKASYLLWSAVLICFFVPWVPVTQPLWGLGRDVLYGIAFGALCGSAAACFLVWQQSKGSCVNKLRGIDCCLYAVCAALGVASQNYAVEDAAFGAARFFVLFCFAALSVTRLCGLLAGETFKANRSFRLSALAAVLLVLLLFMLPACRMLLALVAVCFFVAACFSRCGSEGSGACGEIASRQSGFPAPCSLLAFFFALGFAWEESWRSLGYSAFFSYCFVFCLVAVVFVLVALVASEKQKGRFPCVVVAALCVYSLAFDALCAALAAAMLGSAFFVLTCSERRVLVQECFWSLPAAFGTAVLMGDVVVNGLGDFTTRGITYGFSNLWGLAGSPVTAAVCAILALCLAGLGALAFYVALLMRSPSPKEVASKDSLARDERVFSYLKSQGVSETQALVLVDTAKGMSAAAISSSRHFAQGTVSEARWSGYRTLGIHSKAELIETIARNVKL